MYEEGLIDPEIFTQEYAKYAAKMAGQQMGLFLIRLMILLILQISREFLRLQERRINSMCRHHRQLEIMAYLQSVRTVKT